MRAFDSLHKLILVILGKNNNLLKTCYFGIRESNEQSAHEKDRKQYVL